MHLDHAGGVGKFVEHYPETQVYIHEIGVPHIVDPTRLLASAERVYGEGGLAVFGETIGVPADQVHALHDGDVIAGIEAIHTPGHSAHHMAFMHLESEYALVGDLVGQTIHGFDSKLMSTPPPEVDIELWIESIDKLAAHDPFPSTLGLTHFGRVPDVIEHMESAKRELRRLADLARDSSLEEFLTDQERTLERVPPDVAEALTGSLPPFEQAYAGLTRYWSKRAEREAGASEA